MCTGREFEVATRFDASEVAEARLVLPVSAHRGGLLQWTAAFGRKHDRKVESIALSAKLETLQSRCRQINCLQNSSVR